MEGLKKHIALLYTYNRVELLGRSIRCWLMQEYPEKTLCIFNNSNNPISLTYDIYEEAKGRIFLINQYKQSLTNQHYSNLGEIYNDGISLFYGHLLDSDIVSLWQDDDAYSPKHLNACNTFRGKVYKPYESIYIDRNNGTATYAVNNFEGSWFIDRNFLLHHGFAEPSMHPESKLYQYLDSTNYIADKSLPPTYLYEWNNGVYHSSGGINNPDNFKIFREKNNNTSANTIVRVWSEKEVQENLYLNLTVK